MPTLSMFYGIIVRMFYEVGGKHNFPHIHAQYQDYEIVVNIDTLEVIEGNLPKNKYHLLLAWMTIHQDELQANWKLLSEQSTYFKIAPLH